jgi:hypothetical protein
MQQAARFPALALGAALFCMGAAPARAAEMAPGLWRFTQTTQVEGRGRTRANTRCITPAQAADPARYFAPRGQGCVLTANTAFGSRITSTVRCTQEGVTTEVSSTIVFANPASLSITTTSSSRTPRGTINAVLRGAGQRVAACGARRGHR